MKTLFAAVASATLVLPAMHAAAQGYPGQYGTGPSGSQQGYSASGVQPGHDFRQQLDDLQHRVQDGVTRQQIDQPEADRAFHELASIRQQDSDLHAQNGGGLSDQDRAALQACLDHLSRSIHWMREEGSMVNQAQPYRAPAPTGYAPPPSSQPQSGRWSIEQRIQWLSDRVARGRGDGSLTSHEAHKASYALHNISQMDRRMTYRDGGELSPPDHDMLQQRLEMVSQNIRWERADQERAPWMN